MAEPPPWAEPDPPQPLKRRLRAALLHPLIVALSVVLGALPRRAVQRAGRALGRLLWHLARGERRRILTHLEIAFPDLAPAERLRLARACTRHLGTTLAECLHLMRRDCAAVDAWVAVEGWEDVEAARREGRSILVVSGHCGNWELIHMVANCRGLGMRVIARRLDADRLQDLLAGLRGRFGTETVERGTRGAARQLLAALRDGALALLIDQDTRVDGTWVPFFGRPAYTPLAAGKIAARPDTATFLAFSERRADGSHRLSFQLLDPLPADPAAATARLTERIEQQIRKRPEQWVWMHRRWRRQPAPVAAPTDPDADPGAR